MELIVTSFLLTGLSLFGHIGSVVADQLRRPKRRNWRFGEAFHEPRPPKRASIRFGAAGAEPARA
jgi:hypothetical protein